MATPSRGARLWAALGLRARVTVLFGLGALVLSVMMGGLAYFTTRHFLVSERQNASVHQAYLNAKLVRSTLPLAELSPTGIANCSRRPTRATPGRARCWT